MGVSREYKSSRPTRAPGLGVPPNLSEVHRSSSHEFHDQKQDSRVTEDRSDSSDGQYHVTFRIEDGEGSIHQESGSVPAFGIRDGG